MGRTNYFQTISLATFTKAKLKGLSRVTVYLSPLRTPGAPLKTATPTNCSRRAPQLYNAFMLDLRYVSALPWVISVP